MLGLLPRFLFGFRDLAHVEVLHLLPLAAVGVVVGVVIDHEQFELGALLALCFLSGLALLLLFSRSSLRILLGAAAFSGAPDRADAKNGSSKPRSPSSGAS